MDEKKRKLIIYVIFIAAVIWGISNIGGDKHGTNTVNSDKPTASSRKIVSAHPIKKINIAEYEALKWGRDPFVRATAEIETGSGSNTSPRWVLSGILYSDTNPSAVINKKVVRSGETVDGATVVEIDRQQVILDKDGLQFNLTMAKEAS